MRHENIIAAAQPRAKVYSYTRWSTPEQAKGDSCRRQTEAAAKWAAKRGLELDESLRITDEGVSAYRGTNALDGGLSRFLEACRKGLIEEGSFLLVESLDRISRMSPRKCQRLIDDIVDNGVTIVTLSDNQEYDAVRLDNDPMALLIALMVSWRAHEESKTKGRRVADAWAEKRRKVRKDPSKRLTRCCPSWLQPVSEGGWELIPEKVEIVRRIYRMTLEGTGENQIAAVFNDEGVPVLGRAMRWHRSTVSKVLRSPAVRGRLVPGRIEHIDGKKVRVQEEPIDGAFPSIISEADWLAVRSLKNGRCANARGRHSKRAPAHFLASLARCPRCNGTMSRVSKGRKGGPPKLVCAAAKSHAGCRYRLVNVHEVEDAILRNWGALFENVPSDGGGNDLEREHNDLVGAIAGTEDHYADLVEAFEAAPTQAGSRVVGRVEAELRTMRSQLDELEERRAMSDRGLISSRLRQLNELMNDPDTSRDRPAVNAALKIIFEAVTVDYETGALCFQWRQGGEAVLPYAWPRN